MTGEQFLKQIKTHPFRPFRMHLADGRVLNIDHSEFVAYYQGARTCVVADPKGDGYDTVDLLLVTSIHVPEADGRGKTGRRGEKRT